MRKAFYAAVLLSIVLSPLHPLLTFASDERSEEPVIRVSGSAEEDFMPDTAIVVIAVETTAGTVKEAGAQNNVKAERVVAVLKKTLGEGDTLKTSSYNVQPVYEYDTVRKRSVLAGYRVLNQVTVRTKKVKEAGGLIDAAVMAGANRVEGLRFVVSDYSPLCEGVLKRASRRAIEEAGIVAASFGVKIKGVKEISPSCSIEGERPVYRYAGKEAKAAEAPAPIEAGAVKISADVTAVFYIGDGGAGGAGGVGGK